MSTEISSKNQLDFDYIYGTLFSLSTSIEYLQAIQGIMAERKANYAKNKACEAEKVCQSVYNTLEREITKRMNPEQKEIAINAIEYHKQLVYDFFLMNTTEQKRVRNLMDKINKERK